jgi:7-cyano-7-deazaguanine synthase
MNDAVVVLLSGGLDSTIAMAWARAKGYQVIPVSFVYGQLHTREVESATHVANFYGCKNLALFDLTSIFENFTGALLGTEPMPMGMTYEDLKEAEGIASTYVPFRNGILLSIAAGFAYDNGIPNLCYAAHATDARRGAYPDCTPAFAQAMKDSIYYGTGSQVDLITPFITQTKGEVLKMGLQLEAPIHLTWSCYLGGERPCRECPTCLERAEAFRFAEAEDSLLKEE